MHIYAIENLSLPIVMLRWVTELKTSLVPKKIYSRLNSNEEQKKNFNHSIFHGICFFFSVFVHSRVGVYALAHILLCMRFLLLRIAITKCKSTLSRFTIASIWFHHPSCWCSCLFFFFCCAFQFSIWTLYRLPPFPTTCFIIRRLIIFYS